MDTNRTTEALGLQPEDEPARMIPAIGRRGYRDAELTYDLGRVDGDRASLTVSVSLPQQPDTAQTTEHEPVNPRTVELSFTARAVTAASVRHDDIDRGGAWAGEAITRAQTGTSLTPGARTLHLTNEHERAHLAQLAERYHLNGLTGECAHMPRYHDLPEQHARMIAEPMYRPAWLVSDAMEKWHKIPERYGRADWTGWALRNVRCPETGYRYGHAWLVETIPAEHLATLCHHLPGLADAIDAVRDDYDTTNPHPEPVR